MKIYSTVLAFVTLAVGISGCDDATNEAESKPLPANVQVPPQQQAFTDVVIPFIDKYEAAPNELKKSALRSDRKTAIANVFSGSLEFTDWIGTIKTMETTSEGNAHLEIKLYRTAIQIENNNNEVSAALGDKTLIAKGSELFNKVSELAEGTQVKVSGMFQKGRLDFIDELSLTEKGSMTDPAFAVKFIKIEKVQ